MRRLDCIYSIFLKYIVDYCTTIVLYIKVVYNLNIMYFCIVNNIIKYLYFF